MPDPQIMLLPSGEEIYLIHFVFRGPSAMLLNKQVCKIACAPNLLEGLAMIGRGCPTHHRSDDPIAVTCPMCKDTVAYREAIDRRLR